MRLEPHRSKPSITSPLTQSHISPLYYKHHFYHSSDSHQGNEDMKNFRFPTQWHGFQNLEVFDSVRNSQSYRCTYRLLASSPNHLISTENKMLFPHHNYASFRRSAPGNRYTDLHLLLWRKTLRFFTNGKISIRIFHLKWKSVHSTHL